MSFLLIGIAVAFNFIILLKKYRMKRYFDAFVDMSVLAIICYLFSGTYSALVAGTIASMCVSFYLYFRPVTLRELAGGDDDDDDDF